MPLKCDFRVIVLLTLAFALGGCGKKLRSSHHASTLSPSEPTGAQLYASNCAGCHGSLTSSSKLGRSAAQITNALATIPSMSHISLAPAQVDAIAAALDFSTGPRQRFACTPGQAPVTRMLKLTNREFRAALFGLLDDFNTTLRNDAQLATLLSQVPGDSILTDRNTIKEQALFLNLPMTLGYFEAVYRAGGLVAAANAGLQNYPNTAGCLANATVTQTCHRNFVTELGARAFRRPLTAAEVTDLSGKFWNASYSKTDLLQTTFAGITSLPDFMYKVLDQGPTVTGRTLNLTAHELAAKLSFFLAGAPPDAILRGLASNGQILNTNTLDQQIDRLISAPAGQDMIRRLFRESYGYDVYDSFTYSAEFLGGLNTTGLANSMTQELDWYFPELIINRSATLADVFTSRVSNVGSANLAQVYGTAQGLVTLPPERAGFMNRASMLAKRSGNATSSIKRGLKVLEHILCEPVPPPPPDAPTTIPAATPGSPLLTTRQRTHNMSEQPGTVCLSCHGRMNPLGYAFEYFDSIGRLRTTERIFDANNSLLGSLLVDTSMTTNELGGSTTAANSTELASRIGSSDKAAMCFIKHLKSFEARMLPAAGDGCHMNQSLDTIYGSNGSQGSVRQAIKNYILSTEFKQWTY